jgi:hypothetical protein
VTGGVSTPTIGTGGPLRTCDARAFLAVRDNLYWARAFTTGGSVPCAVILAAGGADGACTGSNLASVASAGTTEAIGRATVGVSADTDLSGCGIIDTAIDARAKPAGSAIQPVHRAAGVMRRRNCWARDLGRGSAGGGGASPCHSHKPDSLLSVLIKTAFAEGDIGAPPVTATAFLYARSMDTPCSACIVHIPSHCSAKIPHAFHGHPGRAQRRHRFRSCPVSLAMAIPTGLVFRQGAPATETIMVSK